MQGTWCLAWLAIMIAGSAVLSMTTDILNAMELLIPLADALEQFEAEMYSHYIKQFKKIRLRQKNLLS